uniref:Uncharacterized protein n=1 Tax=viral metagenome TaxID=1070528 RepID=A0A6M3K6I2_9ZZZZ
MANNSNPGIQRHIDNPANTIVSSTAGTTVTWATQTAGSATDFVRAVAAGKPLHYFGVMDAADNSQSEFASNNLHFTGQNGHCEVEISVAFEDCSEHAFTFGFNDTVQDGNFLIDISATTMTKVSSDFCGFLYDGVDATNKDLHCVWVATDVIGTADMDGSIEGQEIRMRGMAPTDGKWLYMKVSLDDRGSGNGLRATFLAVDHLGRSMEKVFNTTVARTTPFCFHFGVENRTDTGGDVFIINPNWAQTIADL